MYHLVLEEIICQRSDASCFLYHAINAGLDMAIVNSGQITIYDQIPNELKNAIEDVFFNKMKMQQKI